jgi:DNA-binding CsgD family transcriptional regulator
MAARARSNDVDAAHEIELRSESLSVRERQVLELVGAGLRDEEMADRLGIARSTVTMLLRSSMAKLDARTRVEAVAKLAGNHE